MTISNKDLVKFPEGISASAILYSLPYAVFFTDAQMRIIYFNAEAERLTGFKAREACGMYCKDVMKTELCETACIVKRALDNELSIFETETIMKNAVCCTVPVIVSASLIKNTLDEVVGYLHSIRDITFLKKIELSLRESESKLNAMLLSIGDHMSMIDKELNIVWANDVAKKIFGNNIIGKKCYEAYHKRETPCDEHPCSALKAFSDGEIHEHETSVKDKDGNILYFHCTANVALRDKDGSPLTVLEISRDITEQKRLQEQLFHSQKMEAIGLLAGGIAHDFNNLLTAIMGYGKLLEMKIGNDVDLQQIIIAAQKAANLTQSLLIFSRKQHFSPQRTDVNDIIRHTEKLISRVIGEDIEVSVHLLDKKLIVMADITQIEQVLMNLATNARDAMPHGGKLLIKSDMKYLDDIFIKYHGYGKSGCYAEITVQDSGIGMDEKTRTRIFEPFFTTKEMGRGTGLGLAIVYGIIKKHNGYINVYSELGKGTSFKIYLPLDEGIIFNDFTEEEDYVPHGSHSNETLLVAEDDFQVRGFIKTLLEKFGYTVLTASDGDEAIKVFKENKNVISLIILDMLMPKKNGKEVFEEVKRLKPTVDAIFLSGYIDDILLKKGIKEEDIILITKPILPKQFLVKIREILDKQKIK